MGVYELDIYAKTLYGAPLFVSFQATMAAEQRGYGALEVSWTTPIQSDSSQLIAGLKSWTRLRLVRNSYGVPETEDDGWVILEAAAGAGNGTGAPENRFLDDSVVPGQVYYYAVFVSTAPDAYNATATYYPGDLVTYSSKVYSATATSTGLQPDTNPSSWSLTGMTEAWYRCGGCVGLAVKDFRHSELLYDRIPRPYKMDVVESTASAAPVNEQLAKFCRIFGYFFDVIKCENDQLLRMNDVLRCTDHQLGLLAKEMGVDRRLPALPELRRTYIANAALIQRDRGSVDSTQALVKALTGWDSDVQIGYNLLHDMDEAAFASPTYPDWQRDRVYYSTVGSQLYSDIVAYNGSLYAAVGTPRRDSVYLGYTSSNPSRTGTGTIVKDPDQVADPLPGFVRLTGAAQGDTLTYTFAAPAAGSYTVLMVPIADPAGGIITAAVNGAASSAGSVDLYSTTRQQLPIVALGTFTLTATGNTLVLTSTGKNALSQGYNITLSYLLLLGSGVNINIPPTGNAQSAANWQAIAANTLKDTLTEWNPLTGGYGSWNLQQPAGTINPDVTATSTPEWWISPQGAAVGTSSPGSANTLNWTAPTTGTREIFLSGLARANPWDPTNTYFPGQAVTWNPLGWTNPPVYVATTQSVGRQPDISPDKWQFTAYTPNSSPEPSRILTDSVYTPRVVSWSATRSYQKGARVAWRGHLYEAARPSLGIYPSGYNSDNLWWRWCGRNVQRYTFSLYHNRTATASGADVRLWISYYNSSASFGGNIYIVNDAQVLYDRFETTPTYPQATGSAPAGYTMPAAGQQGVPIPWNYTRGTWANSRDVVYPTGWNSSATLERQAGRLLWFQRDWVYPLPTGQAGEQVYATFMSAPDSSQATMEHGIVFRFALNSSYWLASRDRLTYNTITVSGGNVTAVNTTVVATWTPINYGERMRVRNRTGDILVEARAWSGWRTLANVSDTRGNTNTGYGLLERVRP